MKRSKILAVLLALILSLTLFPFKVTASGDRWYGIAEPDISFVRNSGDTVTGVKGYTKVFNNSVYSGFTAYYIVVIMKDMLAEFFYEWIQLGWLNRLVSLETGETETLFYVDWYIDQEYGAKYLDVPAIPGETYLLSIEMYDDQYTWKAYINGVEVASLISERGWRVALQGESYHFYNQMEGHFWGLSFKYADGLATESTGEWHSWSEVRVHVYSAWYDSYNGERVKLDNDIAPYFAIPQSVKSAWKTEFRLLDAGRVAMLVREYMYEIEWLRLIKPTKPGVIYSIIYDEYTREKWL